MVNFSTMLIMIFMVMFWMFRAVVALCTQFSIDFIGITAYNLNTEIIISFVVVLCMVLVVKRKLVGSLLYVIIYCSYFGQHFVANIIPIIQKTTEITIEMSTNLVVDLVAITLAIFTLIDMLVDRNRKKNPSDGKTDWYFKNQKYDEELEKRDKREDKNQYKFY